MNYRIVIDSCGELLDRWKTDERIVSAPLTLEVGGEQIIDDETFDQASFLHKVAQSSECPRSACPSPEYYRAAFECEAKHIYAVTLSAELSGSYNSAVLGKNLLLEEFPDKQIHVFNSCSASGGETLIALKIEELEEAGLSFETIVEQVEEYIYEQNTWFVLENLETLRKNGRLSNLKAFVAGALKIKPLMGANKEGSIYQLGKARGMNKALTLLMDAVVEGTANSTDKILAISHCNCEERAIMVRDAIMSRMVVRDSLILDTAGVSSMYANEGGIIVVI